MEDAFDDDTESIITNERYNYISSIIGSCLTKAKAKNEMTVSDKIDRIVTNRILALPIFAVVMWLVYYIAMSTIGAAATDWTNDNLFGDGFHLFGIGSGAYEEVAEEYGGAAEVVDGFLSYAEEQGMGVVRELVGHGIGQQMHEPPDVPNFAGKSKGPVLRAGMTIAIEPMINLGTHKVRWSSDGWTVSAADGEYSAHYENTIAVTDGEPILLTVFEDDE